MTALRAWRSPAGLRPGDHACRAFSGTAGFRAAVLPFLDEGRRAGEQLLLVGGRREPLLEAVRDLPELEHLLADGRLDVREISGLYGAGSGLDPAGQVAALRGEVDAALRRGRRGLRIAAEITALARDPEDRPRLHRYEQLVGDLFAGAPLTAMCLYDTALGDDVLGPLAVLHPLQQHGDGEPLVHLSGSGPDLALHGEIDTTVADSVRTALVDLARDVRGDVVLDLSGLDFLDVAGARALAMAVRAASADGGRLRLVGARRPIQHCLSLFDLPPEEALPV